MAQHWPSVVLNLSYPSENIAFAHLMNQHRKIVFTQTLNTTRWNNSALVHSNIYDEIKTQKKKKAKNIIIYGSGKLVASLIDTCLIDEYYLWMHPVVLGDGKPLFRTGVQPKEFDLVHTRSFSSGVVLLHYAANNALKTKKEPAKLKALYTK
jgi:dihydrofolate reductase